MKTSLSKIILEETIKASLTEFDVPKPAVTGGGKETTLKPTPKPKPTAKVDAQAIATEIYTSKGVFYDEPKKLVQAVKKIPNATVFFQVNNIIYNTDKKSFSGYLATFINDDEWEVWLPIIKHLSKIIPENQWDPVIKNSLAKTTGIAALTRRDRALGTKISQKLSASAGIEDADGGSNVDLYSLALYGGILAIVCTKFGLKCWKRAKSLMNIGKQPSGVEVANFFEEYFGVAKIKNKRALRKIMNYEYSQGRITKEEYQEMAWLLEKGVSRGKLNKTIFSGVMKQWDRASSSKPIVPGEVKLILAKVDDPEFTRTFGPKLQAVEDRLLGKTPKPKVTTTPGPIKLNVRDITKLGIGTSKPNFAKFDFSRWSTLMGKLGYGISYTEKIFLTGCQPEFLRRVKSGISPEIAARQAMINQIKKVRGGQSMVDLDTIFTEYPAAKRWLDYINKSKSGTKNVKFYNQFTEFPSYEQWVFDMKNAKFRAISKQDYEIAKYNWLNYRTI